MGCSCRKRRPRIKNEELRIFLAEFLGTFVLLTLGNCTVAQTVLFPRSAAGFLSINWGYGLAVGFAVYISFKASGGHVNPAITLGFAVLGLVKWRRVPLYFLAQILGAFASSPVVYGFFYDALNDYDGGNRTVTGPTSTALIFSLYPPDFVSTWSALGQSVTATIIFLVCITALVDKRNANPDPGILPFLVAMVVFACDLAFGATCMNPARDLGPRIFTAMAGWGMEVFSFRNYNWFWVPIVGPLVGCVLGAVMYMLLVELHWPNEYNMSTDAATGVDNEAYITGIDGATENGGSTSTMKIINMVNKEGLSSTSLYS
ncbi:aquaporin-7-like [Lineus longissimus]|uniref:aquaporin-7-like n=1 Tax=Lineus longissimus TaxID=88925 RepID=UPI00315DDE7F